MKHLGQACRLTAEHVMGEQATGEKATGLPGGCHLLQGLAPAFRARELKSGSLLPTLLWCSGYGPDTRGEPLPCGQLHVPTGFQTLDPEGGSCFPEPEQEGGW